ncbi:MAG: glycoside hydrolase family 99-like domain-containing protein [bacterium]|nr:glycoside hydrolase family 99-like domain-containing protein [bacterium]
MANSRLIAFYLPQYHPIPENDIWWGKGFTEWTNVAKAKPLYPGHYQPRIPADLGFYDLRTSETRAAQASLAREYGIEGFCYWHYWFAGKRLLERPFSEVLMSGQPDFPFCLCWANDSWTGVWHGCPDRVLISQSYPGLDDHVRHFHCVLPAFKDKRYIRIDGRPIFVIYKADAIPDLQRFTCLWQELAKSAGLSGIFFIYFNGNSNSTFDFRSQGFDVMLHHNPGWAISRLVRQMGCAPKQKNLRSRVLDFVRNYSRTTPGKPSRYNYRDYIDAALLNPIPSDEFPCLIPNWDNTPRCGSDGFVFENSEPDLFRGYLRKTISSLADRQPDRRMIFIKAWNEWAEGNYLEPDERYGRQLLDVCREENSRNLSELM